MKSQNKSNNTITPGGTLYTTPPAVSCLMITMTPPRYHMGDSRDVSRDVRKHAVSIYRCASVPHFVETSNMEVEEGKGLATAWPIAVGKTLRRRRRLLLPAPVLEARSCVFCGKPHLCLLRLQRIPQHSSPTSQRKRLPPKLPQQSPSISQARHHTSTYLEGDNKTPNHCYHTPCYHTPCRLPGVWHQNLQPQTAITPLPAWSVAAKLLCNH